MKPQKFNHSLYKCQKCIHIVKDKDEKDIWTSLNKKSLFEAIKNLSKPGLELYLYLASNINDFELGLGPTPVFNAIGMSLSSYRRGVEDLENKGYLVYSGEKVIDPNGVEAPKYYFHATPIQK